MKEDKYVIKKQTVNQHLYGYSPEPVLHIKVEYIGLSKDKPFPTREAANAYRSTINHDEALGNLPFPKIVYSVVPLNNQSRDLQNRFS